VEIEAWGGEVIYSEDGPPNSGLPFLRRVEDIGRLDPPQVRETPCLAKVLRAHEQMKARIGDEAPIIGVVMSPFSLPVMQMGFDKYIELMYERPALFDRLMKLNEEFCVAWANAQLVSGATAICYYDPVSSSTIIPPEKYLSTGFPVARRTIARIKGPVATHMASGRCLPIIHHVAETGTAMIGVSALEDLSEIKRACAGKLTVFGNLNGIEMRKWTPARAEESVKRAIDAAGPGGGYILSDNHGEIPFQVPDDVLFAISDAVRAWGSYPLKRYNADSAAK
jgi:uroporphyrinogen decarboxylase